MNFGLDAVCATANATRTAPHTRHRRRRAGDWKCGTEITAHSMYASAPTLPLPSAIISSRSAATETTLHVLADGDGFSKSLTLSLRNNQQ